MALPQYVDISSFQPANVDWSAYVPWSKAVDGIARLAVRASEGTGVGDANYLSYVSGIRAIDHNTVLFHYHYAYPQFNAAGDEVNWMASQVSKAGLNPQDIIMLDFEEHAGNAAWALAWLQAAEKAFGRAPWLYASLSMVQSVLQDRAITRYPLILADWTGGTTPPPSPAPWNDLGAWQYTDSLSGVPGFGSAKVDADFYLATPPPPKPLILHNGCVLDLQKSFQLDGGSQDKCGPWSVSELRFAGLPGQGARGTAGDVQAWARAEYQKWIGPDVPGDQKGSSIDNMHEFLTDATDPQAGGRNLHYWDIPAISPTSQRSHDIAEVIAALDAGYPVLVTVNEQSVKRPNGTSPYPWQPGLGPVNHIFTIVGHTKDGCFLVDDELNAEDGGWPDKYVQSQLEMHWASVVQVVGPDPASPWLSPIPSGDPLTWPGGFNGQLFTGETMGTPTGWKDDGTTLTAPNGVGITLGFRNYILAYPGGWHSGDTPLAPEFHADPLEYSDPSLGAGQKLCTKQHTLEWTPARGVFEAYQGQEVYALLQMFLSAVSNLSGVQAQLTQVQQQLAACVASGGGIPAGLQAAVQDAMAAFQSASREVEKLQAEFQPFLGGTNS